MCSFLFICKYELPPVVKMFLGIDPCEESLVTNGDFLVFLTVVLIVMPLAAAKDINFLGYSSGSDYDVIMTSANYFFYFII